MEFINEFIYLTTKINPKIDNSFCVTTQDATCIYLSFGLNANDCLFDLAENNYEFQIRISKNYLEKYNEPLDINIEKQTICCNTQSRLLDIIKCKLTNIHRKIFLESTILFLLYQSQRNNLVFQVGCDSCAILNKPIEVEKIQLAKKYILDNLANNLTIPIIAGNVGTNQCYLKKGFREVLNKQFLSLFKKIE